MAGSSRKFATARERLRRIEKVIAPYSGPPRNLDEPPRGEWIPGDFIGDDLANERLPPRLDNQAAK